MLYNVVLLSSVQQSESVVCLPKASRDLQTSARVEWYTGIYMLSLPSNPEKTTAPHSSTLAWKIPWMEEPGGLRSMGSRRAGHD